jgi:hypothetical protein
MSSDEKHVVLKGNKQLLGIRNGKRFEQEPTTQTSPKCKGNFLVYVGIHLLDEGKLPNGNEF